MTPRISEFPEGLDCLVQSARRQRQFVQSGWGALLLVLVGLATMFYHGILFLNAEQDVRKQFEERIGTSYHANPDFQKYLKISINQKAALHAGGTVVGALFWLLALGVFWAPIACLTTGVSLFIAEWLIGLVGLLRSGILFERAPGVDSESLYTGIALGFVIRLTVIGLFVAVLRSTVLFRRAMLAAEKGKSQSMDEEGDE